MDEPESMRPDLFSPLFVVTCLSGLVLAFGFGPQRSKLGIGPDRASSLDMFYWRPKHANREEIQSRMMIACSPQSQGGRGAYLYGATACPAVNECPSVVRYVGIRISLATRAICLAWSNRQADRTHPCACRCVVCGVTERSRTTANRYHRGTGCPISSRRAVSSIHARDFVHFSPNSGKKRHITWYILLAMCTLD